jgi:ubiquinone/menaquinone biosynthesis C-methylase UbiE
MKKNIIVAIKEWRDKIFFKKLLKEIQKNDIDVLDIGGGTGWLLTLLKKTDKRIRKTQVVDIDKKAKKIAEQHGHEYYEGSIETFVSDKKFDLILMLNLIEHVADPLAVLKNAESLLQTGGLIVIKTPNTKSWDAKLFKKSYWGGLHCPRHWVIFSPESFLMLLEATSLKLKKQIFTQGAPFWSFSIIAFLHRKKIIHISPAKPIIFHWLFPILSGFFAAFDIIRKPFFKTSQMFLILMH